MSREALRAGVDSVALDHTPFRADLPLLHCPFDSLGMGVAPERRLQAHLLRGDRVALIGRPGTGKTSLTEHVAASREELLLVRVPVAALASDDAADPGRVLTLLLEALRRLGGPQKAPSRLSVRGVEAGIGLAGISGKLALQFQEHSVHAATSVAEQTELVTGLLALAAEHDKTPVLVFDDTDRWVAGLGHDDPRRLRDGFFGRSVRWLIDHVESALLVAAHEQYVAEGLLSALDAVRIPHVDGLAPLRELLAHRLRCASVSAAPEDLLDDAAMRALLDYHVGPAGHSLRQTLLLLKFAVQESLEAGEEIVGEPRVLSARAGLC